MAGKYAHKQGGGPRGNNQRKPRQVIQKNQNVTCEFRDSNGHIEGFWYGNEMLFDGCECPCPGGACLPGCCDLHDF